ncbi:MAG: MFS transporter [Bryobacteraceae bacterium]|nr:MFS transporter [Bryobacteraceae bacterium]
MPRRAASPWPLLALLSFSVVINYLDRSNLSAAAPLLSKEMALSDSELGLLLSSFFWTYALCQILAGWVVDRFNVVLAYAAGFAVWSLATGAIAFAHGFAALVMMRLVLGAGESVAFPAYSKILVRAFPEHERGMANSILDACTKLGPAFGVYFAAWFMQEFGWRPFFLATGFGALAWLPFWLRYAPAQLPGSHSEDGSEAASARGPGWRELLSSRTVWATFLGLFCHNYNWYLLLTWLPTILVRERGFTMAGMGAWNATLLTVTAAATLAAGWSSDRLAARTQDVARLRRGFLITGLLFTAAAMPFTVAGPPWVSAVSLLAAFTGIGIYVSNCWAFTQTLAGAAAGRWTGMQNAFANLGGVIAPALTGFLVERTGQFLAAVLTSSAVLLAGAASYFLLAGPPPAYRRQAAPLGEPGTGSPPAS